MRRPHAACGVAMLAASLVLATPRPLHASVAAATELAPEDATSLIVQADGAHEAGRLSEAAELYARAYQAMSAEEREALGEVVVGVALEDLKATHTATSDVVYARRAGELLDTFERESGAPLPADLAAHRSWIDEALATAPAHNEAEAEPSEVDDTPTPPPTGDRERPRREIAGPTIVAFGAAATIGGVVMVALGAPLGDDAEASREAALADPRLTEATPEDQAQFRLDYADYVRAEKKRGTGLVAGGAVVLAVGVGLLAYGVVRIVQHRRAGGSSARIEPTLGGFRF